MSSRKKPKVSPKKDWPASKVTTAKVADLVPYAENARTHSERQVKQIAASIQEWGWTVPVLVDENGTIIAGHGRILAAKELGIASVPVMVAAGWTDAQKRAYVIADNKLAENAGWDELILSAELQELADVDFDLGVIGFGSHELAELLKTPDFDPGSESDQGNLDTLAPKMVTCPHCGEAFDSRAKT